MPDHTPDDPPREVTLRSIIVPTDLRQPYDLLIPFAMYPSELPPRLAFAKSVIKENSRLH